MTSADPQVDTSASCSEFNIFESALAAFCAPSLSSYRYNPCTYAVTSDSDRASPDCLPGDKLTTYQPGAEISLWLWNDAREKIPMINGLW